MEGGDAGSEMQAIQGGLFSLYGKWLLTKVTENVAVAEKAP